MLAHHLSWQVGGEYDEGGERQARAPQAVEPARLDPLGDLAAAGELGAMDGDLEVAVGDRVAHPREPLSFRGRDGPESEHQSTMSRASNASPKSRKIAKILGKTACVLC